MINRIFMHLVGSLISITAAFALLIMAAVSALFLIKVLLIGASFGLVAAAVLAADWAYKRLAKPELYVVFQYRAFRLILSATGIILIIIWWLL